MSQLICDRLSVGYEDGTVASGISFTAEKGDYLVIVGENGSGKSTLLKTLLGLIPPLAGSVSFAEGVSRKSIGYLPQQTAAQRDFPASAWEIVLSGCLSRRPGRPFYDREQKAAAAACMEKLGIGGLAKKPYRLLSGGQQQRVLLARALCAAEKMIFLDEPAAGLDPAAAENMYEQIASLNREGMTVIMISHDLQAAEKYAGSVLDMSGLGSKAAEAEEAPTKGGSLR